MNAIDLLEKQHRETEELFEKLEKAGIEEKEELFNQLADALAMHTTIEEQHLYPASVGARTEDMLREAVEEHLAVKRIISDLLELDVDDPSFDAKVKVMKEQVEHHVKEEERDLFPAVQKLLGKEKLEELGQVMEATAKGMEGKDVRTAVPAQTLAAAPIEPEAPAKKGRRAA